MRASGHIVSPHGRGLPWTDGDAVWLRRAVEAEGPPRDWVAQALVNRWATLQDGPNAASYPTLTDFVRAYSQPVNPRWYPDGDLHLAQLKAHASRGPAHQQEMIERAEARRDVLSRRTRFSPATLQAVAQALEGPVTLPAGVTDFAMDSAEARRAHGTPFRSSPGQNAFWQRVPGALYSIAPNYPTHPAGRALRTAGPHAGFGVALLLGFVATPFVVSARASSRLRRRRA